jgi:glycosyltransferase involved in cell wall biosynthesis
MYRWFIIKRLIEDIIIFPFVLIGKLVGSFYPQKEEYEIFFFFSFYHIGGAEKVHAQIASVLGNKNCIIFFTRRSHNDLFYKHFQDTGCVIRDISKYTDNKLLYFMNLIYRGILAYHINRQRKKPVLFNGQCNFGYKITPWIKRSIPQVELIHSFNTFSWIRLPFLPFITRTIMISTTRIDDHVQQYRRLGVPDKYDRRIQYIINGIHLPEQPRARNNNTNRILYVGRATPEKRVHLVAQIAEQVHATNKEITFAFMGDAQNVIPAALRAHCEFIPYTNDEKLIASEYNRADVLIIVSSTEGFPMVIMEAMAHGCVIMATPVGDIPVHIKQGVNGFLFSTAENETAIVQEGMDYLMKLKANPALLHQLSENNINYARAHFDIDTFKATYVALIHSLKGNAH